MTRIFVGIDDTDVAGGAISTARLARELGETLRSEMRFIGSLGHILFTGVKATTNNKASCIILECDADLALDSLFERSKTNLNEARRIQRLEFAVAAY